MYDFARLSVVIGWAEDGGVKSYCNEISNIWKFVTEASNVSAALNFSS